MKFKVPARGAAQMLWLAFLMHQGCAGEEGTSVESPRGRLVVSEFLYRSGVDTLEWIELRNDGDGAARLAGVKISGAGYQFADSTRDLPSGKRILVVNSPELFAARHPGVPIFDRFSGRLSDEGERLALMGSDEPGFVVSWSRKEPWPQAAARMGFSMVWLGGDPASPGSWASSARWGGEPGGPETKGSDPGIFLSEVRPIDPSGKGFVELGSLAAQPVDVSGWVLFDPKNPQDSLVLPAGTTVPARGAVVFAQTPSGAQSPWGKLHPEAEGGTLVLAAKGTDGAANGVAHAISWEAIPAGASMVRADSWGTGLQVDPTPGRLDSLVSPPPVHLAEVCYNLSSGEEFVELVNDLETPLALGNATDSTMSWKLEGLGLRFASTDTLPARGRMLLIAAVHSDEPTFRAAHKVPTGVLIRTFPGRLDDAGERLQLGHPLLPVTNSAGKLEWKSRVVDQASWLPGFPWPLSANGGGHCLERIDPRIPGDSPRAWRAASPTPGA
ncbi:MAG: lamin tail domain-containing protein [Fibrobacteria bacterium]|nr:lamin tail domain-containing protein [Fibrobacteria bacterium]